MKISQNPIKNIQKYLPNLCDVIVLNCVIQININTLKIFGDIILISISLSTYNKSNNFETKYIIVST